MRTGIDWDNLECCRSPSRPSAKDIYALNESKLGERENQGLPLHQYTLLLLFPLLFLCVRLSHVSPSFSYILLCCSFPSFFSYVTLIYFVFKIKLGLFPDEKSSRKVLLTDQDHRLYCNWNFVSQSSFEQEIVDFLILEETMVRTQRRLSERVLFVCNFHLEIVCSTMKKQRN